MHTLMITTFMLHVAGFSFPTHNVEEFKTYAACGVARDTSNAGAVKYLGFGFPTPAEVSYHHAECYKVKSN